MVVGPRGPRNMCLLFPTIGWESAPSDSNLLQQALRQRIYISWYSVIMELKVGGQRKVWGDLFDEMIQIVSF